MVETKKTVLFIVEGASDKVALEKIFQKIYQSNRKIIFRFTGGDISSDETITIGNVCDKINQIVHEFLKSSKLHRSDIYQIIQLFDMDGAYIPDTAIVSGSSNDLEYHLTNISCKNPIKAKKRNLHKSEIMNYLLTIHDIKSIPYEMYFMSCNLDHALYDCQNLDDELKQEYADAFYEEFSSKEKMFIEFLKTDVVNGTPNEYPQSWRYIKTDLHSLERHTNLHIYFDRHPVL